MDECGEEWAALHVGVLRKLFDSGLVVFPCAFHKITQALDKASNLGKGGAPTSKCFDLIRACLRDIGSYYEDKEEARKALLTLRTFSADALGRTVYAKFRAFLDRLEKDIDIWGFYAVKSAITMLQKTSNRVEVVNAIIKGRGGDRFVETCPGILTLANLHMQRHTRKLTNS
jgi:hypothetical protein